MRSRLYVLVAAWVLLAATPALAQTTGGIRGTAVDQDGNPMPGVVISVTRILALYIPLAFIGKELFGIVGIFGAYAVANILSGTLGYFWAKANAHRLFEKAA